MTCKPRLLDLFCGRWGWSKGFLAHGWECYGIDLVMPPEIPEGCHFAKFDVLDLTLEHIRKINPDFVCCSSPCNEFSVHMRKNFHPNPPWPAMGIKLFEHSRDLCEASGKPFVMENVKAAQQFIGKATNHAGSFYLWGNAVPVLVPKLRKSTWVMQPGRRGNACKEDFMPRKMRSALLSEIPFALASQVALSAS